MWLVWPRTWNSKFHLILMNSNLHSHQWPRAGIFGQPSSRDFLGILFPSEKEMTTFHFIHPPTTSTSSPSRFWPLGSISLHSQEQPSGFSPVFSDCSLLQVVPPEGFSWVTAASAGRGHRLGLRAMFHLEPQLRLPCAISANSPSWSGTSRPDRVAQGQTDDSWDEPESEPARADTSPYLLTPEVKIQRNRGLGSCDTSLYPNLPLESKEDSIRQTRRLTLPVARWLVWIHRTGGSEVEVARMCCVLE